MMSDLYFNEESNYSEENMKRLLLHQSSSISAEA